VRALAKQRKKGSVSYTRALKKTNGEPEERKGLGVPLKQIRLEKNFNNKKFQESKEEYTGREKLKNTSPAAARGLKAHVTWA